MAPCTGIVETGADVVGPLIGVVDGTEGVGATPTTVTTGFRAKDFWTISASVHELGVLGVPTGFITFSYNCVPTIFV